MLALIKLFVSLVPVVKPLVVQIVREIARSSSESEQKEKARILLEEAMRLRAFDERMRARSPKA